MTPFRRHSAFMIGALVGFGAFGAAYALKHPLSYAIGANAFFATYILMILRAMPLLTADFLCRRAQQADEPVWIIFLVTIGVVCVAVVSLFLLMNGKHILSPYWLAFSVLSLPLGWFTIHAMAAMHYAHLFWTGSDKVDASTHRHLPTGGMLFPDTDRPVGWDFLYFSLVIGMTAQTADTNITTTSMRRAVMVHSIVSFFFNTVIMAAAVNLVVSLPG